MDLKEKAKSAPKSPGVYFMKDSLNLIIYVGKSKNLKQRLNQYFGVSYHKSPKVEKMLRNIRDFEYTVVDTELEAFLLESKLIKELKPMYNRQIKKYMGYPYIEVTVCERYPVIRIIQKRENPDSLYFGPFHSLKGVEKAIEILKKDQWLRMGRTDDKRKWNPLNEQTGSLISRLNVETEKEYDEYIRKVISIMRGEDSSFLEHLKSKMQQASSNYRFEEAAKYRDEYRVLKYVIHASKVAEEAKLPKGLVVFEKIIDKLGKIFLFYGSKLLYSELVHLKNERMDECILNIQKIIKTCFEQLIMSGGQDINKANLDEAHIIQAYIKGKGDSVRYFEVDDSYFNDCDGKARLEQNLKNILY